MNKAGLPVDETLGDEGKNQVEEIDRVLSQARFAAVRDDFETGISNMVAGLPGIPRLV